MAANILDVCDALVEVITDGLDDPADAQVERVYLAPIAQKDDTERRVWVYPTRYNKTPASRGEDEWVHSVSVVVAEWHRDAGEPPKSWVDERVTFTESKVFSALDFSHEYLVFSTTRRLLTYQADCVVFDAAKLESKLFWSELTFEFREIKTT
jgi:hypothetical protein